MAFAFAVDVLTQTWGLVVQSALFLLVGFAVAGFLHEFLPTARLVAWLGARRWTSVLRAALIGTPLPLCSCAVVPVASSLRKGGASRGATTAFVIATPESGVESIAATYALMDPAMTIARPLSAFGTALAAGLAENAWGEADDSTPQAALDNCGAETCLCSSEATAKRGWSARLLGALRYGLIDMLEDLGGYMAAGFVLAGVLAVVLARFEPLQTALTSAWAPLVMLLAGIPVYVCAASATPMIAVLVSQGLAPGAGLVFLLAGPATNAAGVVLLSRILGRRAVVIYLVTIAICALLAGTLLDQFYALSGITPTALARSAVCCTAPTWTSLAAAIGLIALIAVGISRSSSKRWFGINPGATASSDA